MLELSDPPDLALSRPPSRAALIPPYVFAGSLLYVISYKLAKCIRERCFTRRDEFSNEVSTTTCSLKELFQAYDGICIIAFRVARFACCAALVRLQAEKPFDLYNSLADFSMVLLYLYATVLAFGTIFARAFWRDFYSRQLFVILSIDYAVHVHLNLWPLCTVRCYPFDPLDHWTFWPITICLTIASVVVPLLMPRPLRAGKDHLVPGLEETASLFSRYTISYVTGALFRAYRAASLSVDELPQMSNTYKSDVMARKLKYLDPLLVKRRQSFLWGTIRAFRWKYLSLFALKISSSLTTFLGPIGMRNLLLYVETGQYVYGVKPWVWVVLLSFGPLFSAMMSTHVIKASTRQVVSVESVVTQLVFEHTLRIRMTTDTADEDRSQTSPHSSESLVSSVAAGPELVVSEAPASLSQSTTDAHAEGQATTSKNGPSIGADAELEVGVAAATTETTLEEIKWDSLVSMKKPEISHLVGKINSLVTTDLSDVEYLQDALSLPACIVRIIVSTIFLYSLLGWSALVGLVSMLIFIPIPARLGSLLVNVNKESKTLTDKRVQTVAESLSVLRMIKLFSWEPFIFQKISDARSEEVKKMRYNRILSIINYSISEILPLISKVLTFAIYSLVMKQELTASIIFTSLLLFEGVESGMRYSFTLLPDTLRSLVTFERYTDFFNSTEVLPSVLKAHDAEAQSMDATCPPSKQDQIGLSNCTFSWAPFDVQRQGRRNFKLTFREEVVFQRGRINLIVGPTASGKTSVLMALLGEMHYMPNSPSAWYNLPRDGGISYAAQESWVLNDTVKTNIVFDQPFDEDRYNKVIRQCGLDRDLSLWAAGDMTEVGERGLTLSGGQRARITLARALYSAASIVLLDDVLAALDVHTAKHVVNEALKGDLARGRTIILVTHNIPLTAPIAEYIIHLGKDGSLLKHGPASDVIGISPLLRAEVEESQGPIGTAEVEAMIDTEGLTTKPGADATAGKLVVSEEKATGRLEFGAIMLYVHSYGGIVAWTVTSLLTGSTIAAFIAQPWFIGVWSSQYEKHAPSEIQVKWYFSVYAVIACACVFINCTKRTFTAFRNKVAHEAIHRKLIDSILRAPIRWLDVTPVGRILTRCTEDIGVVDYKFPAMFHTLIFLVLQNLSYFVITTIQAGFYSLIPGLVLAVAGGFLSSVYLRAQINVKREMNVRKSPILGQIGTVLAGLQSIRAYGSQRYFRQELDKRLDDHIRASIAFYDFNLWVSVQLDFLGAIFSCAVASFLIYGSTSSAGSIGFTMSLVLTFADSILYIVETYNSLEASCNLERIWGYLKIKHEPPATEGITPPAYWPASGDLHVQGLSARYSEDSPEVLKNITFKIKSGEHIGVVGRTGAGKSTIALALLRAIKTTGKVYYDGLITDELSLRSLRSKVTLIPQQPELIQGTIRENLDPFGEQDDAFLNHALRVSQLHEIKDSLVGEIQDVQTGASEESQRSIGLDTLVESGGTNFSMGQRQIIALARAIVRKSKLLILDEATAAIEHETDRAIQKALRAELGNDTTMITIAHRLQTIMDYDMIMVLDAGQLVEFDTPANLLTKDGGLFRALVEESEERDLLKSMVV